MLRPAGVLLLFALAACGGAPQKVGEGQPGNSAPAAVKTTASQPAVKPAPAAPKKAKAVPAAKPPVQSAAPQSAAVEPEASAPPVRVIPVNDDPAQFMGESDGALRIALGEPALIRRDGPAEVWQFRGADCTLDLFLYRGESSGLTVKHVDLRGEAPAERRACLADLIRAQLAAAEG